MHATLLHFINRYESIYGRILTRKKSSIVKKMAEYLLSYSYGDNGNYCKNENFKSLTIRHYILHLKYDLYMMNYCNFLDGRDFNINYKFAHSFKKFEIHYSNIFELPHSSSRLSNK